MTGEAKNPGFCDACIVPGLLAKMVETDFTDGLLADLRVRKGTAELIRLVAENGTCEAQAPEPDYAGEGSHTFMCKHEHALLVMSSLGDALSTASSAPDIVSTTLRDDELTPELKQVLTD